MTFGLNRTCLTPSTLALAAVTVAALTVGSAALAQRERHAPPPPRWHGDISRFHEHDWHLWRGGHWEYARHGGRIGWWWVVGGAWYLYPAPVYPYPNPWEPPAVIVAPPVEPPPPPPAPPTQYWYYCEASHGYYPYLTTCPGGWKPVPAIPAGTAPAQPK